jgi:N-acetylglutamate synthase-like GNAT family acetyltransferase
MTFEISTHDSHPLEEPLSSIAVSVKPTMLLLRCTKCCPCHASARTETGRVVGGAVGRWWGQCCELQQLWVETSYRRRGIGTQLIQAFEARAREQGCSTFYLETFSFQTPRLYELLGYTVAYEHKVHPHDIVKYIMVKHHQNAA